MAVTGLDLAALLALIALIGGMGGVTVRAWMLLLQLIPPKSGWVERGVLLAILFLGYVIVVGLGVPGILAGMKAGQTHTSLESVFRTSTLAAWVWSLNTILLMLARGQLGDPVRWGRR